MTSSGMAVDIRLRGCDALYDAFGAEAGFDLGEVVFDGTLGANPVDVARDSLLDRDRGLVAHRAGASDVGDEGANFAGTELAACERLDADVELVGDDAREIADCGCTATADVDGQAVDLVG